MCRMRRGLALGRHSKAEAHLLTALRISPAHLKATQKLEQVRADAIAHVQARFDADYQLRMVEAAAEACGSVEGNAAHAMDDGSGTEDERAGQQSRRHLERVSCIESHLNSSRVAREADGPWLV